MKKSNNLFTIYGLNNCLNLLDNYKNRFTIDCIYIMKDSKAASNQIIQRKIKELSVKFLDKKIFFNQFSYKHTQGIIISFSGYKPYNFIKYNDDTLNQCYIIIDQMSDPQNLGQIIRTSECAGIDGIILPQHGSVHITDTVLQVSQGAFIHSKIFIVNNLTQMIKEMQDNGFWIVGVENSIDAKNWHQIDFKGKIGIVIGSEGKGIRTLVRKSCDFMCTIPMQGKINSLNITAALSAILFERQRQIETK